ncbi:restriction endonuclease subunit S [Lachnoclostridium sp. An76]|uniref:restriction endonuclease subunit S n=1 Tax=Lachnoclostridium sp. An76 TaxID=1965654 RepID=UPI000B3A2A37|nr:restriction endonuclease subunit S [Lachnoclostridium sp. An76]OUN33836.1 hypothetical protein B5G27_10115 [Lachnoclostridium sp. An76]
MDFSEIFEDKTKYGTKLKTDEYEEQGKYLIVDQGQELIAGYTDKKEGFFSELPVIIFGDHTRILKYIDQPFYIGADGVKILRCKLQNANYRYLFYALKNVYIPNTGYNRHFKWLKQSSIKYPDSVTQDKIVEILDTVSDIIQLRKKELNQLDYLIKSRFVEMFGDPIVNSMGLATASMAELCEIIDGDRGKNYPKGDELSNEGDCLFLNAKNVTPQGFNFNTCTFISREKDEALRKGKLTRGDVVLTTRGTIGNLAFYSNEIPYEHVRINSGMVILRMKQGVMDEVYFIEQFKMKLADVKEKIASGSAQPQLPISTMNKIQMLAPDITNQKHFSEFVREIDKSKLTIQKSLDELETLNKALMQKYFGGNGV